MDSPLYKKRHSFALLGMEIWEGLLVSMKATRALHEQTFRYYAKQIDRNVMHSGDEKNLLQKQLKNEFFFDNDKKYPNFNCTKFINYCNEETIDVSWISDLCTKTLKHTPTRLSRFKSGASVKEWQEMFHKTYQELSTVQSGHSFSHVCIRISFVCLLCCIIIFVCFIECFIQI